MAFEKCKTPPTDQDLAIPKPDDALDHLAAINVQHRYWSKRQTRAEEDVDLPTHELALALHTEFADFNRGVVLQTTHVRDPWYIERDRQRVLGSLAMSLLFRRILSATNDLPTYDGKAYKFSNLLGDMMQDENGMPLEPRLHMMTRQADRILPAPEEGVEEQWYRQGSLYVRRTTEASPSDPVVLWLLEREIQAPFDQMTTLYPAVASVT